MNVWKNTLLATTLALATLAVPAAAQIQTNLTLTVAAEASLTVNAATALSKATIFGDYTGTTSLTYKLRTTKIGGSGMITASVSNFTAGGPSVTNDLKYTCSSSVGVCKATGATTPPVATAFDLIEFQADDHSARLGTTDPLLWTLINDPAVETGNHSATVTFTISAS